MPAVAEVVAARLVDAGVNVVFGLPGGENVPLLEALRRYDIDFVLVRNESSAVFAASAFARLSGRPGVSITTLGPGVVNAAAGLGHAYLDREPVIYISAAVDEAVRPQHTHQYIDQSSLLNPITKMSVSLTPENVDMAMDDALRFCRSGRPGPVHLQISRREISEEVVQIKTQPGPVTPDPVAGPTLIDVANRLSRYQRPVIVAGLGLGAGSPYESLEQLATRLGAPVITTPKAKGSVPADHPLAAGTIGLTRNDPVYDILAEADGVLAVGFDVVELVRPWDEQAELIWVSAWPNDDPVLPAAADLVGPLEEIIPDLASLVQPRVTSWGTVRVGNFRQAKTSQPRPAPGRISPIEVINAARATTPPEIIVTTDVGSHKILAGLEWPALQPNRFLVSNGMSCMGFGLAAAIGAAMVEPATPILSIHGDGGLAMVVGELGVLAERELPVIVVVMNDGALDLIRAKQLHSEVPPYGTEFWSPDWVAVARGFGIEGVRVTSMDGCAREMRDAIARGKPYLIEALIDPAGYLTAKK